MVGYKPKDLIGIPWMVAFALRADGWYLRSEIIWSKPNPMPESVTDRPTKAHEQVFLLAKSRFYFYDANAISEVAQYAGDDRRARTDNTVAQRIGYKSQTERSEPTNERRNKRSVWEITTQPYAEAHFATFPTKLVEPMVLAGSPYGSLVLDPFAGAGTTLKVAVGLGRSAIGIELNPEYATMARRRLAGVTPAMF
jgi:DNA modification methylase